MPISEKRQSNGALNCVTPRAAAAMARGINVGMRKMLRQKARRLAPFNATALNRALILRLSLQPQRLNGALFPGDAGDAEDDE